MDRKITYPNNQHRNIDGKDPDHEHQDRMCIVIEVVVGVRALCLGQRLYGKYW